MRKPTTSVAESFTWQDGPAGRALISNALAEYATHAFTTRALAFRQSAMDDNSRLARVLSVRPEDIVRVRQVHGRGIVVVRPGEDATRLSDADALLSIDPARAIAVHVADCVPVLVADRQARVVAAIHAGWRGTVAGVAAAAVHAISALGISPRDLVAAIGPSIGPCCYQVDRPVRDAFLAVKPGAASWFDDDGPERWKLDLWEANISALVETGVPRDAIHVSAYCTADHLDDCFSYRREGPGTGRMVAGIRLRPSSE